MKSVHKTIISLIAVSLLVAMGVAASVWSFEQADASAVARKKSYVVIKGASDFLSELRDAETGQRGYLLTGDAAFLEPYLDVRDGISAHLAQLHQLTANIDALKKLDTVAPLLAEKMAALAYSIELRRNRNAATAQAFVTRGRGKELMDSIRTEMTEFIAIEEGILAHREEDFKSQMRRLLSIIIAASVAAILLSLAFVWIIYRQTKQQIANQTHLETQRLLEMQEALNKQLHQANITLQVSEERLAVTLNSIGDAVITTDAESLVTLLNPAAEQLTGWTNEQANGRKIDDIFHIVNKDTRQYATIPVAAVLAHGTIHGLANHTILIARDGRENDIADSCAPIRDVEGHVIGTVLVFRNVSDEYAAQRVLSRQQEELEAQNNELTSSREDLDASRARYFDLYDLAPVGYCTLNAAGLITESNAAIAALLGLERGSVNGNSFSGFLLAADADRFHLLKNRLAESGEKETVEFQLEGKGGRRFWAYITATVAEDKGQLTLRFAITDITARKLAEIDLLKAGALQSAIFNSANFSSIATDAKGVIQIFNVGAERMLGYAAADVMNKITPADISDSQEVIARAKALSVELDTPITPGFEALVFKAS